MPKWSPLERGQLLLVSEKHVAMAARFDKPNLRMGHAVQYSHDDAYIAAKMICTPSADMAAFDRTYLGYLHDDKAAGFVADGTPSDKHTVSHQEHVVWENERKKHDRDVIIHSFELLEPYADDGLPFWVRYCAPCSWLNVRTNLYEGKDSYYFYKQAAARWSPY